MKVENVDLSQAVGYILLHNQVDSSGRKVLKKGHLITRADIPTLQSLGVEQVYIAILSDDDVNENEAARRLGAAIAGAGMITSSATTGRVNLIADTAGLLKVNVEALTAFNDNYGITLGTLPTNSVVQPKTMLATLKIIPYSIPNSTLDSTEATARTTPLLQLKPFTIKQAVLIPTGTEAAKEKVVGGFSGPLRHRLTAYGTEMTVGPYVSKGEEKIAAALEQALAGNAGLIIIVGETSIMDINDIIPRAINRIGGQVVHYGVPAEPGNLLLLAYHNNTPIVGAPGCAKSRSYNVVDMVLPRLAAGERLTRRDLVELGHGGLLK